jgi:hypothetical protein
MRDHETVSGEEGIEKKCRRIYRATLDAEVAPALSALGFEVKGRGGYSLLWNEGFDFSTNVRELKWNKFGAKKFDVDLSIWMIETTEDRWVRGIWLPIPHQWIFDSPEAMDGLGDRLLMGILHSAVPLAVEKWGPPSNAQIGAIAVESDLEAARSTGGWHIPGGES